MNGEQEKVSFNLFLPKECYDGLEKIRERCGHSSVAQTIKAMVKLIEEHPEIFEEPPED